MENNFYDVSQELQLPHSFESEQSVLGGLILDNSRFDLVTEIIGVNDFYRDGHRVIFKTMLNLRNQNMPFDVVTLAETLNSHSELERVGGIAYLAEMGQHTPSAANITAYSKIVKDTAIQRQILALSNQINKVIYSDGDAAEKLERVNQLFSSLEITDNQVERDPYDVLKSCADIWDRRAKSQNGLMGYSTGFAEIDNRTAGLQAPDFIVIAGKSGDGKTTLAMNMASAVAINQKIPTLVFSLEMGAEQLMDKFISSIGQIPLRAIKRGEVFQQRFGGQLDHAMKKIKSSPLYIDDRANLSISQIQSTARRFRRKHGECLIVVDYVQLVGGQGMGKEERTSDVSKKLKQLAKELSVPVIGLSQMNRNNLARTEKRPIASDLRDSAALEHDCDILIMLWQPENNPDNIMEAIFRKHRNGEQGTDYLFKKLYVSTFEDVKADFDPNAQTEQEAGFIY